MLRFWVLILVLCTTMAFCQSDRGTITGIVNDPSGAAVPAAAVTAVHTGTGGEFRTTTTDTGAYTLPSLSSGAYSVTIEKAGFKKYTQERALVQVASTLRIDVTLQMGTATETVTVSAEATMLQETSEYNLSMRGQRMRDLPLNFATGPGAIRTPFGFLELMPGASNATLGVQEASGYGIDIRVNGMPNNTFKTLVDGQDATNPYKARNAEESQPSNEALEAFTLQSSNYAAEFGRAGGGVINFTTKSGSNDWHGSAYDYFRNEVLSAGLPWSNDGNGHLVRGRDRQQDFGFSLGGPVRIPKLYDGRNKTFFFFNYEMFRRSEMRYSGLLNAPTEAFRNGDFSALLTGRNIGTDQSGRTLSEGVLYDSTTDHTVDGVIVREVFPGNQIPKSRMDPVALKIQSLIPTPKIAGTQPYNNYWNYTPTRKIMSIPSIKVDQVIGNARLSVYYSRERVDKDNGPDGWPTPISGWRYQNIRATTARVTYDHTLSPTLFNHAGFGILRYQNPDQAADPNFDSAGVLGLKGTIHSGFPSLTINNFTPTTNWGMGASINLILATKPNATESLTWVHGNHTFKFGGEWTQEIGGKSTFLTGVGSYTFSASQTGLPYSQTMTGGIVGNGYASFLLGYADTGKMGPYGGVLYRRMVWGFFAQDTWKATRKLTVDYGVRYDLQPVQHEQLYRTASFDPTLANPTVGGLKGALRYEGNGPGRCNCRFAPTYPYQIGPRLGLAWQVAPKTVLRAGWGISYARSANLSSDSTYSAGFGFNSINVSNAAPGKPAFLLANGIPYSQSDLFAYNQSPGLRPLSSTSAPTTLDIPFVDPNAGRAPRIQQWNITIQRQLTADLVVQAAYVGNRVIWLENNSQVDYNALTPQRLASAGIDITSATDQKLLTSQLGSAAAKARGFTAPYAGFPMTATVAQSLRPYPQFGTVKSLWAPLGNSWYDALQVNATKRMSHGLDASIAYTWSKNLANTQDEGGSSVFINDPFNRNNNKTFSSYDQPQVLAVGFNYEVPGTSRGGNRALRMLTSNWSLRGVLRYASGMPILVPMANSNLGAYMFRSTVANRVAGKPVLLQDLNSRNFDPTKTLVFNPEAWVDPPAGQLGSSSPYYNDYRYQRRPKESASIARTFHIREAVRIDLRAEFFNIFNRATVPDPTGTNAAVTPRYNATTGATIQGFGRIDTNAVPAGTPRSGQIVLRVSF